RRPLLNFSALKGSEGLANCLLLGNLVSAVSADAVVLPVDSNGKLTNPWVVKVGYFLTDLGGCIVSSRLERCAASPKIVVQNRAGGIIGNSVRVAIASLGNITVPLLMRHRASIGPNRQIDHDTQSGD